MQIKNETTVEVLNHEPKSTLIEPITFPSKYSDSKLLEIIAGLAEENQRLRDTNSSLFVYKERVEKFEKLNKIFDDERFMETWLETNIHKAIADLEIIDRQPIITWPISGLKTD